MKPNFNNGFHVFVIHSFITIFILFLFLYLMLYWWYPPPYFELEGGWDVLGILVGANVILGPLLTLIVFKRDKPGLFFDLSIIACLQIAALAYGGNIIYKERPIFIVFAVDRFTLVSTNDIQMEYLIDSSLGKNNSRGPIPVYTAIPEDNKKKNDLLLQTLLYGANDLEFRAEYYEPLLPHLKKVILRGREISKYYTHDKNKSKVDLFLANNSLSIKDLSFFPVVGKKKDMLIAINSKTGEIKGAINIDPWLRN